MQNQFDSSNNSLVGRSRLSYAASRRRLGIVYVGTIVIASVWALSSGAAVSWFGPEDKSSVDWFANILTFVACYEIFSLPLDVIGFRIERAFGKTRESIPAYLVRWCKAAMKHSMIFLSCTFVFTSAAHICGVAGVALSSAALAILFVWKQGEIARFLSEVHFEEPEQELRATFVQNRSDRVGIVVARSPESGFTGGIVGLPGAESIVIPDCWLESLTGRMLWAEICRRNSAISTGSRARGVLWAVAFTVTGATLSSACVEYVLGHPIVSSAGAAETSFLFTLWSFLGLLVLPFLSQGGVLEVDHEAFARGVSRELLLETILDIDRSMENEPERSDVVQFVFHPIPTPARRMSALDAGEKKIGAWNVARYAICLSIAGLGLLGRAVHCNAGKPDLWCMLPAD
jgi:hypothetical protein